MTTRVGHHRLAVEGTGKCSATTPCIYRKYGPKGYGPSHSPCRRKIHCTIKSGHKSGHRFGSHASQHT